MLIRLHELITTEGNTEKIQRGPQRVPVLSLWFSSAVPSVFYSVVINSCALINI